MKCKICNETDENKLGSNTYLNKYKQLIITCGYDSNYDEDYFIVKDAENFIIKYNLSNIYLECYLICNNCMENLIKNNEIKIVENYLYNDGPNIIESFKINSERQLLIAYSDVRFGILTIGKLESDIPHGNMCMDKQNNICKYHELFLDTKPMCRSGYCHYLNYGDWMKTNEIGEKISPSLTKYNKYCNINEK